MRDAQTELGTRVDCRASKIAAVPCTPPPAPDAAACAKGLGKAVLPGARPPSAPAQALQETVRMPSMLDPHVEEIDRWLAAEPRLTALAILGRLAARCPGQFGPPQHTIVQRLLKDLRRKAVGRLIAGTGTAAAATAPPSGTAKSRRSEALPLLPPACGPTTRPTSVTRFPLAAVGYRHIDISTDRVKMLGTIRRSRLARYLWSQL
jgi:hypothetical protein